MQRFAILLAGRVFASADLKAALAGRRIVAADGGMAHAAELGVLPELWVGDFDSVPAGLPDDLAAVERRRAPRDKDETDAELAAEAAMALGASDILFVGALGGARSDHAFSNLVLAMHLAERGICVELFDGLERGVPLGPAPRRIATGAGQVFSILRFTDVAGLNVDGARWRLEQADIPFGSIVTQSNEALGPIEVSLREGRALVLVQCRGDEPNAATRR